MRRLLSRMPRAGWRLVIGFAVLVALVVASPIYAWVTSGARIDPALSAAESGSARVNVIVVLTFAPTQFHLKTLQGYGVLGAVHGTSVQLSRVSPANLRALGYLAWIDRVIPAPAS